MGTEPVHELFSVSKKTAIINTWLFWETEQQTIFEE